MKQIILIVAMLLGLTVTTSAQTPAPSTADEHWKAFRQVFPYHIQTIAMSARRDDGSTSLIITEPPPHVTLASIRTVGQSLFDGAAVKRHPVGVDGWVSDVVVDLPPLSDSQLRELLDALHRHLFHTAYKAHAVGLPIRDAARPEARLDLTVSVADLRRWLVEEKETFRSLHGGQPLPLGELLRLKRTGVYLSTKPGLVLWTVPRRADLAVFQREARQFAVDSDLVLGAIADTDHLAIVGRERTLPVTVLPPLRTETIMLLASVQTDQLAQSYERTNLFAGKLFLVDWAPIYLSDALIDTEYGGLLNITDQLLKSWSMNGEVRYSNFSYPDPKVWPFPKPLIDELKTHQVTFNWNTRGAGYTVQAGATRWLALNRVGALPVSYFASSSAVNQHEERAYGYFASTNDPNLARVVQYTALFQIFREYGIRTAGAPSRTRPHPETEALAAEAIAFLRSLLALTETQLGTELRELEITPSDRAKVLEQFRKVHETLSAFRREYGDAGLRAIALRIANPRLPAAVPNLGRSKSEMLATIEKLSREQLRELGAVYLAEDLSQQPLRSVLSVFIDRTRAFERYREAADRRPTSEWIRTPSVVLSLLTTRALTSTGGHNVDGLGVQYRVSADVSPGKVRATTENGRRVILHHERDIPRIHALLREAAIEPPGPALGTKLEKTLSGVKTSARARTDALLVADAPRTARGLTTDPAVDQLNAGWRLSEASAVAPNPAAQLSRGGWPSVTLERLSDGRFRLFHEGLDAPIDAASVTSLGDLAEAVLRGRASSARPVQMHFVGFTENESTGLVRTLEIRLAGPGQPKLAGFTYGRDVTAQHAFTSFSTKYDFSKARVIERGVADASSAPRGFQEVRLSVEIPAFEPAKPSLLLRIRMLLSEKVIAPTREAVQRMVSDAFKLGTGTADAHAGVAGLWQRLKALHPGTDVEIQYQHEAVDIIITKVGTDGPDHSQSHPAA